MDGELLIALCVLWFSTTVALIGFLCMWYLNGGEAFHPHSVEIEPTHRAFVVVSSKTTCKYDCAVKSISAFAAPRGSTSYQQFTALSVMIAVSGFLGTARWQAVGDANRIEAILSYIGFSSLLLVATFEVDVSPETFLKDKLLVTSWLIEKLGAHKEYPFNQPSTSKEFLDFVRKSPRIYDLFEEDRVVLNHADKSWYYNPVWGTLHMLGALIYISCVTASIILNDMAEEKVGWITGVHFLIFGFLGYLTGNYLPVIAPLRGYILTWNPFYSDPDFMENLKWVCLLICCIMVFWFDLMLFVSIVVLLCFSRSLNIKKHSINPNVLEPTNSTREIPCWYQKKIILKDLVRDIKLRVRSLQ